MKPPQPKDNSKCSSPDTTSGEQARPNGRDPLSGLDRPRPVTITQPLSRYDFFGAGTYHIYGPLRTSAFGRYTSRRTDELAYNRGVVRSVPSVVL
jgi:hypothetical protein